MSIFTQPFARLRVIGACMDDEAPEMARVIEPPQMHQLVNQHVIAHTVGHQNESPVQADMTRRGTGAPPGALIPYADARHVQSVMRCKPQQMLRQLARRAAPQLVDCLGCVCEPRPGPRSQLRPLTFNPGTLLLGKQFRMAARSPSWDGDSNASVRTDTNDITPGSGMADEIHERINIQCSRGPTLARAAGAIVLRHES